jgi:hypothetical protein
VHETGQAGGLIAEEHDAARFGERQAGLDGARIEADLAQDSAIGVVLRIEERDLGEEEEPGCSDRKLQLLPGFCGISGVSRAMVPADSTR